MNAKELEILVEEKFKTIDEKLDGILEQTTLTNGRVSVLEKWRNVLTGVWIAIGVMAAIISFIAGMVFTYMEVIK